MDLGPFITTFASAGEAGVIAKGVLRSGRAGGPLRVCKLGEGRWHRSPRGDLDLPGSVLRLPTLVYGESFTFLSDINVCADSVTFGKMAQIPRPLPGFA